MPKANRHDLPWPQPCPPEQCQHVYPLPEPCPPERSQHVYPLPEPCPPERSQHVYPGYDATTTSVASSSRPPPPQFLGTERYQHVYPGYDATTTSMAPSSSPPPPQFLGTYGDMSLLEGGLHRKKYGDISDSYHRLHAKAGEKMDPRMLMLLEFFGELYLRRRELFKKTFPGRQDDFVDTFKKIRALLLSGKSGQDSNTRALRRSLSVGSTRTRSVGGDEPLRPQKFKVKTINPGGGVGAGGGGSQGGQGDVKTAGGGSNSK